MSDGKKSFVYVKGDASKTPVDPKAQPVGTDLVLVLASGKEVEVKAGLFRPADEAAAAARKASMGPTEDAELFADKNKVQAKLARKLAK